MCPDCLFHEWMNDMEWQDPAKVFVAQKRSVSFAFPRWQKMFLISLIFCLGRSIPLLSMRTQPQRSRFFNVSEKQWVSVLGSWLEKEEREQNFHPHLWLPGPSGPVSSYSFRDETSVSMSLWPSGIISLHLLCKERAKEEESSEKREGGHTCARTCTLFWTCHLHLLIWLPWHTSVTWTWTFILVICSPNNRHLKTVIWEVHSQAGNLIFFGWIFAAFLHVLRGQSCSWQAGVAQGMSTSCYTESGSSLA